MALLCRVHQDGTSVVEQTDAPIVNTFEIDDNGYAVITSNSTTLRFNYASDQLRFRYYKSGQQPIYLYKEIPVPTVEVTIKDGFEGTTVSSPFALDLTKAQGLTAYIATGKVGSKNVFITTQSVNAVAPAKTGLLVKGNAATTYNIPVTLSTEANAAAFNGNLLEEAIDGYTPTDDDIAAKSIYRYVKSNVSGKSGFQVVTKAGQTVSAGKAYLRLNDELAAAAAAMGLIIDGEEVTAIESVSAEKAESNAPRYNLAGQRVNAAYKGVVIQNGKKMILK